MQPQQNIEDIWDVIKLYYRTGHLLKLVSHQIESYNNFIEVQIRKTIDMFNPVIINSDQYTNKNTKKSCLTIKVEFGKF